MGQNHGKDGKNAGGGGEEHILDDGGNFNARAAARAHLAHHGGSSTDAASHGGGGGGGCPVVHAPGAKNPHAHHGKGRHGAGGANSGSGSGAGSPHPPTSPTPEPGPRRVGSKKRKRRVRKMAVSSGGIPRQGLVTADDRLRIVDVNAAIEELFGYTKSELVGQRVEMLMPSPYREQHESYVDRYEASGKPRAMDIRRTLEAQHKLGHIFPIHFTVTEAPDEAAENIAYIGIVEEIHDPSVVLTIDVAGTILYCNRNITNIFGYHKLEVRRKNINMLMPEPFSSLHDEYITRYLTTGEKYVLDRVRNVPALHKDGTVFPVSLAVTELEHNGKPIFRGVINAVERLEANLSFTDRGKITSCTKSFHLLFGYHKEELVDSHVSTLVPELTPEVLGTRYLELEAGAFECTAAHKDGSTFGISLNISKFVPTSEERDAFFDTGSTSGSPDNSAANDDDDDDDLDDEAAAAARERRRRKKRFMYSAFIQRIKHSNVDASNYEASIGQLTLGEGDARAARHLKRYSVAVTLGSGASGTVKLANSEDLDAMVAIKVVNTKALDPRGIDMQRVRNEIQVLQRCDHPNIVRLHEVMETEGHLYMVMEYADGGDLTEFWAGDQALEDGVPEAAAREIFRQLALAIQYLHDRDMVHRDVKCDNIMIDARTNTVKLVDFGYACALSSPEEKLTNFCGTPIYAAPEIFLNTAYSYEADVWSMGVVLYALAFGRFPFETGRDIVRGAYYLPLPEDTTVTEPALDAIERILVIDQARRPPIAAVLDDPWLTSTPPDDTVDLSIPSHTPLSTAKYAYPGAQIVDVASTQSTAAAATTT